MYARFSANALYFGLGVLAYNTAQALKLFFLDKEWRRHTIGTLRWRLVEIAGKVIRHGRQLILKLAEYRWRSLRFFSESESYALSLADGEKREARACGEN